MTTLHNFSAVANHEANSDGSGPDGGLVQGSDGNFYGTTEGGGTQAFGTIFQITPAGKLTSLYSFSGSDGGLPYAGLIQDGGSFYGTTRFFGLPGGGGTVFRLTLTEPLTITSPVSVTATVGQAFTYQITATNSPTAFAAGGLPVGLSVNPSTGSITGMPTAIGDYAVKLTVGNAFGTGSATLNLVVSPRWPSPVRPAPRPWSVSGSRIRLRPRIRPSLQRRTAFLVV